MVTALLNRSATRHEGTIGAQLRYWRQVRHLSQLALAGKADVSARHVCFMETGRAKPSRDMVLVLSRVLDVPLRERNQLLLAAGFAPVYPETPLDEPELAPVSGALDAILRQQEPFPALIMNRHWDILRSNDAAIRFSRFFLGAGSPSAPANLLHRIFSPAAMRPFVENWEAVATALLQRVHRECVGAVLDERTHALLAELLTYPGIPDTRHPPDPSAPMLPILSVGYVKGDQRFDYFSTVTTLGTPQDITLQEIRIEAFYPVDAATAAAARRLAETPD
jgi:transcriptional regulator with XRE-family HTH domain